jgi:hypothetical protein
MKTTYNSTNKVLMLLSVYGRIQHQVQTKCRQYKLRITDIQTEKQIRGTAPEVMDTSV